MHRVSSSRLGRSLPGAGGRRRTPVRGLPPAPFAAVPAVLLAAGLALAASACTVPEPGPGQAPAAKQPSSSAAGAGPEAEKAEGEKVGAKPQSWWRRITRSPNAGEDPWVYGDVRPGKGLASGGEHGFVLLHKREAPQSDPTKPTKTRR